MAPAFRPLPSGINFFGKPEGKCAKDKQGVGQGQHYSNCHAELVSASNEFEALGDPETSSG
jgi:hypothetical protein